MQLIHERARKYISAIEAISGQRGHAATYAAALALVKGFGLPEPEALPLLLEWNATNAQPPWREADLRHKLRDAAKSTRPLGYLLNDRERNPLADWKCQSTPPDDDGAAKRAAWPALHPLSAESLRAIADLRRVPIAAVGMLCASGFLRGAMVDGQRAFIIREGDFAQARRFDGQPFTLHDGRQVKAKNLPGSRGAFIGQQWLGGQGITGGPPPVLLVEGVIALLEATAVAWLTDADTRGWTILAATSASARFDAALLARLAGRRIRIVPDADAAGLEAAAAWLASLESAGCAVDAFRLPDGCKDLGPLSASPASHRETLTRLLTP